MQEFVTAAESLVVTIEGLQERISDITQDMGTLSDDIRKVQESLEQLEDRLRNLEEQISTPDPAPEPAEPPIEVHEPYPSNPEVVLSPGAIVQPHLTAGSVVELRPGSYGDQVIAPAEGVHLFCRQPYGALFQSSSLNSRSWVETGGSHVTIQGIKIDGYGRSDSTNVNSSRWAAFRFPSGSKGWKVIDCEVMRSVGTGFELRGSDHEIVRAKIHDCGRYGWVDGVRVKWVEPEVWRIAVRDSSALVPAWHVNADRGTCKMATSSTGVYIKDIYIHDLPDKGVWWDGARDGEIDGIKVRNIGHSGVNVEIGWGGAENPPPGRTTTWPHPAFVIRNFDIENAYGVDARNPSTWPVPAALAAPMSPGVLFENGIVTNCGNGSGWVFNSAHSVFTNGYPSLNISADWAKQNLNSKNVIFRGITFEGTMTQFVAGYTGGDNGPGPEWRSNNYNASGRYRWRNSYMSLEQWRTLHSALWA